MGIWLQKPTMPRRKAEWVRRKTSQLVAILVIQVPTSETVCDRIDMVPTKMKTAATAAAEGHAQVIYKIPASRFWIESIA